MGKRKQTSEDFIAQLHKKAEKKFAEGNRSGLIMSVLILWDTFDFTKDDIDNFVDNYQILLESYNDGHEDLEAWVEGIKEEIGIDILPVK